MAQRCAVCGKHPAVGSRISHAHKRHQAPVAAEPRLGPDRRRGRAQAASGLHALREGGQDHQERLSDGARHGATVPGTGSG